MFIGFHRLWDGWRLRFIEKELPTDKIEEMEILVVDVTNAMFHAATEIGMRYEARHTAELMK